MAFLERWRLLVTSEERIDNIMGVAELAYSVRPFNEVVSQAIQIESKVFEASTSKENYMSMMDNVISNIKKFIENETRSRLEQMAAKYIQNALEERMKQINEESGKSDEEKTREILIREEQLLKNLWENYVKEHLEQTRQQQKANAECLRLMVQSMELQKYAANYRQQQQNLSSSTRSSASTIEAKEVEPNSSTQTSSTSSITEFPPSSSSPSSDFPSNSFSPDHTKS